MDRQQKINNIGIWTEMYSSYIDLVYTLQELRIKKGFTQAEVSFLLGRPTNQISWIERFVPDIEYSVLDIVYFSELFDCTVTDFFTKKNDGFGKELVGVYENQDSYGVKYYEAYVLKDGSYHFIYEISEYHLRVHKIKNTRKEIEDCINKLLETDYFKTAVSPLDIFIHCKTQISSDFKPKHLQQVLKKYFQRGSPKPLKRIKQNSRILYIQKTWLKKL